ncbi:hypothetical protein P7K49_026618 [Saguinus oedipus]|uniref:Uncharacterized protein n=1 Tax=Saguinus oedipus TaxID=9490 RepID=A0ABQ9UDN9_SAGOE|nr:hypothetical protein P7K49_026618 [Saguinus oedipus]
MVAAKTEGLVALCRLHSPGTRGSPPGLPSTARTQSTRRENPVNPPREPSQTACDTEMHRQDPAQLPAMRMTARSAGSRTLPLVLAPPALRRLRQCVARTG